MKYENIKEFLDKVVVNNKISYLDRDKLNKMIMSYSKQEDLDMEKFREVIYIFSSWCIGGVRQEQISYRIIDKSLKENNISFKNDIKKEEYTETFKSLLKLDLKKQTILWSDINLFIFKFSQNGRNFLIENKINLNKLDNYCWKFLNKDIISYEDIENNKYTENLKLVKDLCPQYLKSLDWPKIVMNSHLITLLSIDYKHDLNQKQIIEYFHLIEGKIQEKQNDDEKFNFLINHFAEVMSQSSFFRFNVSKWKDLKINLGKTFGISMNNIKDYNDDLSPTKKFIFLLAENPILKHENMKNKIGNNEKLKLFGKIYLNETEILEYENIKKTKSLKKSIKI